MLNLTDLNVSEELDQAALTAIAGGTCYRICGMHSHRWGCFRPTRKFKIVLKRKCGRVYRARVRLYKRARVQCQYAYKV